MLARIAAGWVHGGALAGLVLLFLAPVLTAGWGTGEMLAFLALPAYMLHQLEEHDGDRFRLFVNALMGGEALSVRDVFLINFVGVWLVLALDFWAMRMVDPGWAALAGWLLIVNGLLHLVQAVALRRGNPGLWTGIAVFLPLGAGIVAQAGAGLAQTVISVVLIVALHVAILVRARGNIRRGGGAGRVPG